MTTPYAVRGSARADARRACPHCGATPVTRTTVSWYPELDYLTCEACKAVWTIPSERERKAPPKKKGEDGE